MEKLLFTESLYTIVYTVEENQVVKVQLRNWSILKNIAESYLPISI